MPLLDFPNELLLFVAASLPRPRHLYALLRANQRLSHLLLPLLRRLALADKDGMNALLWAALHGHTGLIAQTLAAGFTINMRGHANPEDGKTPLYRAIQSGCLAAVELLLARGADPHIPTFTYATPLHEAAAYGSEEMVALILAAVGDVDLTVDTHQSTALHWAAAAKRTANLRFILIRSPRAPGYIDDKDLSDNTALHTALALTTHRHSTPPDDVVRLLLSRGALPNPINNAGCTPLYLAAELGLPSTIALLLAHGADPHASGYSRHTPLHHVASGGDIKIAALLIDGGASPAYPDQRGKTPLDLAYKYAERNPSGVDMLELLLKRSEGIPVGGLVLCNILWWASGDELENIVRLLLRRITHFRNETVMQWAVRRKDQMVIRVLQEMQNEGEKS
ncbi:hypothetical protein Q9L58_008214 [Maublancomyces gigas]|uniref:protein S-acyltransferase n=1 Tax=Discina gigas TaxID=1032678 RepID=A0ABR3GAK3_9PEZI